MKKSQCKFSVKGSVYSTRTGKISKYSCYINARDPEVGCEECPYYQCEIAAKEAAK